MTAYTREMLVNEALSVLGVVGAGQTADSEDQEKVDDRVEALLEELAARDVVTVADDDDIAPAQFGALAELLANECAPSFGLPKNSNVKEAAEDRLKTVNRRGRLSDLKSTIDIAVTAPPGLSLARWSRGG